MGAFLLDAYFLYWLAAESANYKCGIAQFTLVCECIKPKRYLLLVMTGNAR